MEYQSTFYISFFDFEKAFDCLKRENMWQARKAFRIPIKTKSLVHEMCREFSCRVGKNGNFTETFFFLKVGWVWYPSVDAYLR
jgi:hypothetical protein